jgi:hypothetical protein
MIATFRAGERATHSGLYRVIHGWRHAETHPITVVCGDIFPRCLHCCEDVRFELEVAAGYVGAHPYFRLSDW